jgi:putative transposase
MMRADGHQASTSTVERALRRRGLLLPWGFRADRKSWAALRRKVFHDPPTGRDVDALACLDAAVNKAERVLGLDDLRDDRGERELVDENTGEVTDVVPAPIAVVSDNGSCLRGETCQSAFAAMSRCCATSGPASGARRPTASSSDSSAR